MQGSWKKLVHKISFEDTSKQKRAEQTNIHNKTGNPVLTGVLSYGAGFISHKLGMLAGKKVESLAEQVLENFFDKIKAAISKRKKR
jgi:carbon monoxide dehydrogenase subunit G